MNVLWTILSSATIATLLTSALAWLLKSIISQRLLSAVKYEYDVKLETFGARLAGEREQELEKLRTQLVVKSGDRTRRLERLLKQYERQIEEFYGPLWNMVHQLYVCNETKSKIIDGVKAGEEAALVEQYYQTTYFMPLHTEIREIIKTKLYLVEGTEMPDSFYRYLEHALQERDQRTLAREYHVDTSFLQGVEWPEKFHSDIKRGYKTAMFHYQECLTGLKE